MEPDCRILKATFAPEPAQAKGIRVQPDRLREKFISLLRENDGELLRELLETLSRDKSLYARRLIGCLVEQPELRDLIYTKRMLH